MEVKSPGFPDAVSAIKPGECFVLTRSEGTFVGIKTKMPVGCPSQYTHWCVVISPSEPPRLMNISGMSDRMAIRLADTFIQISGNLKHASSRGLNLPGSISVSSEKDIQLVAVNSEGDWSLVNLASGEITENSNREARSSFLAWSLVRVVNERLETIIDFEAPIPTQK